MRIQAALVVSLAKLGFPIAGEEIKNKTMRLVMNERTIVKLSIGKYKPFDENENGHLVIREVGR